MASEAGVLYTGVTNAIRRRTRQHKDEINDGFSKKYQTKSLVYYEAFSDIYAAIEREKAIKTFSRERKAALIDSKNPKWIDLSHEWFG
jgi:putative endonuclease